LLLIRRPAIGKSVSLSLKFNCKLRNGGKPKELGLALRVIQKAKMKLKRLNGTAERDCSAVLDSLRRQSAFLIFQKYGHDDQKAHANSKASLDARHRDA
jgi:hypothetical protein